MEWYHVCWPRLTAKRVEPVVSISWASCFIALRCRSARSLLSSGVLRPSVCVSCLCFICTRLTMLSNFSVCTVLTNIHYSDHMRWIPIERETTFIVGVNVRRNNGAFTWKENTFILKTVHRKRYEIGLVICCASDDANFYFLASHDAIWASHLSIIMLWVPRCIRPKWVIHHWRDNNSGITGVTLFVSFIRHVEWNTRYDVHCDCECRR